MTLSSKEILIRLGNGAMIAEICELCRWTRAEFDAWWREECCRRVPPAQGSRGLKGLHGSARIQRDAWGIPHVFADDDDDLFAAYGYALAQDRLFQLDYMRRKARGRLAEILGPSQVESDLNFRTIGIGRIADAEWATLPGETRRMLSAFTAGINAFMEEAHMCPPIEFEMLSYEPEAWHPSDSLALIGEFRHYLTVRFPVIGIPELAKRTLGEGKLYREFITAEIDEESIVQPGDYTPAPRSVARGRVGETAGGDDGGGSNNWVLAGGRTTNGKPLLANDPHLPHQAVSIWHEVHLKGGSFNIAGVALVGMPAVMIGRNPHVAFGITNNICMQRDLYQEKTDPEHPGCFLYDGRWEPAQVREEVIPVRGAPAVRKFIVSSRHGPIVDEILPPAMRSTGPVSLRWLGAEPCGWLTALLNMNRARSAAEFREATRPWVCPTFNIVYADAAGHIGMQTVGRIPLRAEPERGYRPGWDPRHTWQGTIPFEGMPSIVDPKRGMAVTANNRLAPDDYPYPLSGCWATGHRCRRIRLRLESQPTWSLEQTQILQMDVHSGRAEEGLAGLLAALKRDDDPRVRQAVEILARWDMRVEAESAGAAIFNVFFVHWTKVVSAERFPAGQASFVYANAGGISLRLLTKDAHGWFTKTPREAAMRLAFHATLEELAKRLGPDMASWKWGRLHTLAQKHFLSGRGDLGTLLDRSGLPVRGDSQTVCSGTPDASYATYIGATYRMVADMSDPRHGMWAIEVSSASGHPGSPHYDDQLIPWNAGQMHYLPLEGPIEGEDVMHLHGKPNV
jgi:penicillin amidase